MHRAIDESLNGSPCSYVSIGSAQETMCGVMTQIDTAELPHELVDIEILPQVAQVDGAQNEFG
ncbi:MAG TPA: hypothetical protein VIX59_20310 [Candidatus Binataceae bacterium]